MDRALAVDPLLDTVVEARRDGSSEQIGHGAWVLIVSVWVDWINLNMVFQAVLWPLRLVAGWSVGQALGITCVVAVWSLLCFAVVAWGLLKPSGGRRLAAMGGCVGIWFAEPVLLWAASKGQAGVWSMWVSPLGVFESITQDSALWSPQLIMGRVTVVAVAAVLIWIGLAMLMVGQQGIEGTICKRVANVRNTREPD